MKLLNVYRVIIRHLCHKTLVVVSSSTSSTVVVIMVLVAVLQLH